MSSKSVFNSALDHRIVYDRSDLEKTFLPAGALLQLDRVLEVAGPRVVGEMDLANHWAFEFHFPSDPIFPGSLLTEASGQTVAIWAWYNDLRGKPRLVKSVARFEHPVLPEDGVVVFEAFVRRRKNLCLATVEATVGDRRAARFELVVMIIHGKEFDLAAG